MAILPALQLPVQRMREADCLTLTRSSPAWRRRAGRRSSTAGRDPADLAACRGRHQLADEAKVPHFSPRTALRPAASARAGLGGASTSGRSRPRARWTAPATSRCARVSPRPIRRLLMRRAALLLAALAVLAGGGAPRAPDQSRLPGPFRAYDIGGLELRTQRFDGTAGLVPTGPCPGRPEFGRNGCLTMTEDLDGMPALAHGWRPTGSPTAGRRSGRSGASRDRHRSRTRGGYGVLPRPRVSLAGHQRPDPGAADLIGPFTTQRALDQALAVAREAGFIAPHPAPRTRF